MSAAIRAIVFDLDDTLFAERDYAISGFEAVGAWVAANFPGIDGSSSAGGGGSAGGAGTDGSSGFAARAKELFEQGKRGTIFNEVVAQYPFAWPEDIVLRMVAVFREHRPVLALAPGIPLLLQALRQRGFKLGIITDGLLAVQKNKVAALGLAALVDAVVYSDTWGRAAWKPSPRPFREMETALGVRPKQCLYIGDNPVKDIPGAHGAGWSAWRLRLPGREHSLLEDAPALSKPDFVARDWPALELALSYNISE
jgi:putative hydrolase of the HAD superfamily